MSDPVSIDDKLKELDRKRDELRAAFKYNMWALDVEETKLLGLKPPPKEKYLDAHTERS